MLALQNELSPNASKCSQRLNEKLDQTRGKLQTGFVGTPFLCAALTENGMEHRAYELLLNEEYPGWLYEVNLGATTIWERWNSMNPDGSVSSTDMNSFNHYAYGSIAQWMCEYAAGLKAAAPGFRKAVIAPVPNVRLRKMDFIYASAAGTYRIAWETVDDYTLKLKVEIPFGCEAVLKLPYSGESQNLSAGSYAFMHKTSEPMRKIYTADDLLVDLLASPAATAVLEKAKPGISNTPDSLCNQSLRQFLRKYSGAGNEQIDFIDKTLRAV